jgi:proteasome accessory factor C
VSTRPSETLRRLERLLVVVPWLLEHPGADVAEVGERLGVPAEDLLADLDLLGYCGLPGYGGGDLIEVSIVGTAVTLRMADYFRRPLRLSLREAVTLLLAARALSGVEGLADSAALDRAAGRLEQALGAETGTPGMAVELGGPGAEHLGVLRAAVADRRVVRIVHRAEATGAITERAVEPWSLTAAAGEWYLQGWCRTAGGPRDFRVDRIRELEVTAEQAGAPATAPPPPRYRPEPDDPEIVLDCDPEAWWVAEWAVVDDVEERRGGIRRIRLRAHHLDWAARLVLRLDGHATVVAPAELAPRVAELAEAALVRYPPAS